MNLFKNSCDKTTVDIGDIRKRIKNGKMNIESFQDLCFKAKVVSAEDFVNTILECTDINRTTYHVHPELGEPICRSKQLKR